MAGPRRNVALTNTLLALLAPLAACSFDAAGLGQSGEAGPGGTDSPATSGQTTGADSTTGPTTGPTTQTSAGSGDSGTSETSDSSGAVDPGTSSSTTDGTSTTDATASTGGADTTTGGESSSSGSCVEQTFFADGDGDGFGDPGKSVMACEQPDGHVANSDDCDDGDDAVSLGADEICDGKDNDCDTHKDEFAAGTNLDCEGCKMALYEGAVYHFCGASKKWVDAESGCKARGAALVDDNDMEEHDWLVSQLPVDTGAWHIGGRAPGGDDKFVWLDGTAVPDPDPRWGVLRPAPGGGTNYLSLVSEDNSLTWSAYKGQWYDLHGNTEAPYICQGPLH